MQIKSITPPVTGWLEIDLDENIITYLNELIDQSKIDNISMKDSLAGHISSSLALKDKEDYLMDNLLINCANQFDQAFPAAAKLVNHIGTQQRLALNSLWVNYMKKNEYNPPHDHSDYLSFVIFLKVPEEITKEQEDFVGNSAGPGSLSFLYGDGNRQSITYQSVKPQDRDIFIFPAWIKHYVAPFYSDVTRISVSGNISNSVFLNQIKKVNQNEGK